MSLARLRALVVVGVLVLSAVILVIVAIVKDSSGTTVAENCPAGKVAVDLTLPEDFSTVKVAVYNATTSGALAGQVAEEFRSRKVTVVDVKNLNPTSKPVDGVAVLRYGPKTVGSAWLVRAFFLNRAELQFDPKRADDVIDVIVGKQYLQLGSITEVRQALGAVGGPRLPEGACDANAG